MVALCRYGGGRILPGANSDPFYLQETTLYGCTVRINEPVGVVGVACPDEYPLLAFVSLFAPAIVRGNTIIIVPSEAHPLSATDLYQVRGWGSATPTRGVASL